MAESQLKSLPIESGLNQPFKRLAYFCGIENSSFIGVFYVPIAPFFVEEGAMVYLSPLMKREQNQSQGQDGQETRKISPPVTVVAIQTA